MIPINEIKKIFDKHGAVIKTADFTTHKIYYAGIQKLIIAGYIEKIKTGYYGWIQDNVVSEAALVMRFFPKAIINMDSALFYYHYSDRTPAYWHIAVSKYSAQSKYKIYYPFIKPYFIDPDILEIGLDSGEIDSVSVRIYNRERVICDVLKYVNKMDREMFNKAIQGYVNDNSKNIARLLDYAVKLRVYAKVKQWMGVWL